MLKIIVVFALTLLGFMLNTYLLRIRHATEIVDVYNTLQQLERKNVGLREQVKQHLEIIEKLIKARNAVDILFGEYNIHVSPHQAIAELENRDSRSKLVEKCAARLLPLEANDMRTQTLCRSAQLYVSPGDREFTDRSICDRYFRVNPLEVDTCKSVSENRYDDPDRDECAALIKSVRLRN